jgi:hypothetical protein
MTHTAKQRVALTDDNWHDSLPMDYLEKLTAELPPAPDGYLTDYKTVTRLLAWFGPPRLNF